MTSEIEIIPKHLYYSYTENSKDTMVEKKLNRLKVIPAEKNLSNKWSSEQLGVGQATISKWITNSSQSNLEILLRVPECLQVSFEELVRFDALPKIEKKKIIYKMW